MEIHWGCLTPAPQGGWGPDCQFLLTLLLGSLLSPRAWRVWGWGECSGPGFPCRAQDGRHSGHAPWSHHLFTRWKYFCRKPGSTALLQSSSCVWG